MNRRQFTQMLSFLVGGASLPFPLLSAGKKQSKGPEKEIRFVNGRYVIDMHIFPPPYADVLTITNLGTNFTIGFPNDTSHLECSSRKKHTIVRYKDQPSDISFEIWVPLYDDIRLYTGTYTANFDQTKVYHNFFSIPGFNLQKQEIKEFYFKPV